MEQDVQFTKLTADLLMVAKGFCEYGESEGLLTPDGLKFAITKRKEVVKQLAAAGKSEREIAALTGVAKTTIHRDLNGDGPKRTNGGPKRTAKPKPEPEEEEQDETATDPHALPTAMRVRGFMHRAKEAQEMALADDMAGIETTQKMRDAARNAALAWTELLEKLEGE